MAFLVSGGGTGIGLASAWALREQGADVVLCGRREATLRAAAEQVGASWVVADCADEADVEGAVATVVQRHGALTGVVAAAGTMHSGGVLDTWPAEWDAALRGNATTAFLLARAALPQLIEHRGTIVFVSSIAALRSSSGSAAYAVAKAAVVSLGQAVAVEHGPHGVRSNVVCPGWVRTPMADAELGSLADDPYREITALVPQRRAAEPREVGDAVAWLCSPAASYVNGAVLTVDGGTTLVDAGTVPFDVTVTPR